VSSERSSLPPIDTDVHELPHHGNQHTMSISGLVEAFIECRPALLRYLRLRGATAEEAQDILQEVHLKLWAEKIGPVEQPRAYLYKMTNNHFLLQRRTADRRARREGDWMATHSGEQSEVDERPSAEAGLIVHQQLAVLQQALDALPERTTTIFRRFRLDGEPQRQIALDLGISVSAIEKHLTRAYEAIAAARLRLDGD
jgi:RNA polymerase sigma factor (sigma-70 family)